MEYSRILHYYYNYRDYPDYGLYTTPHIFSVDWLNEVWDQESPGAEDQHQVKDDYRFVYMGPKGTWY